MKVRCGSQDAPTSIRALPLTRAHRVTIPWAWAWGPQPCTCFQSALGPPALCLRQNHPRVATLPPRAPPLAHTLCAAPRGCAALAPEIPSQVLFSLFLRTLRAGELRRAARTRGWGPAELHTLGHSWQAPVGARPALCWAWRSGRSWASLDGQTTWTREAGPSACPGVACSPLLMGIMLQAVPPGWRWLPRAGPEPGREPGLGRAHAAERKAACTRLGWPGCTAPPHARETAWGGSRLGHT